MITPSEIDGAGLFETRYTAFLAAIPQLRPVLHHYCTRMTGSISDGEDVMQEALFEAYRKLESFDEVQALKPWLFRIAHHRCIDLLRRRAVREQAEAAALEPDGMEALDPEPQPLDHALERLVIALPPKERACVLLKDVFEYSLEEIAGLVDSTVGGVKAALNRGRGKLARSPDEPQAKPAASAETLELLRLYAERFNRRDWDGVRELTCADARLRVADCFAGRLADSPYFIEYERDPIPWRMALGEVDGDAVILILHENPDGWTPFSLVHISVAAGRVVRIVDYFKCPWVLPAAASVRLYP